MKDRFKEEEFFRQIDPIERLRVFQDYYTNIERKEIEANRIIKDAVRRDHRKIRERFRDLLSSRYKNDSFHFRTPWTHVAAAIKEEPEYIAMLNIEG